MESGRKMTTIQVKTDIRDRLKAIAKRDKMTIGEVIGRLIDRFGQEDPSPFKERDYDEDLLL